MVRKYRKKPICIEAVQFTRENWGEVVLFTNNTAYKNLEWHINTVISCIIPTPEGFHVATENDYIIKGVYGEFYPCKPNIFKETYEIILGD